jgi:hypothetical protein
MKHKGCGPGVTMLLIPQFIFRASCEKHDEYYDIGGGLIEKVYADVMFCAYMLEDIKKGQFGFWKRYGYFLVVLLYFILVSIFGLFIFKWKFYGKN